LTRANAKTMPFWVKFLLGFTAALLVGALVLVLITRTPYAPEELLQDLMGTEEENGEELSGASDPSFGVPRFENGFLEPVRTGALALSGPDGVYWKNGKGQICSVSSGRATFSGEAESPRVCGTCAVYRDGLNALRADTGEREYICADVRGKEVWAFEREDMLYVFSLDGKTLYLNRFLPSGEKDRYDNRPLLLRREGEAVDGIASLKTSETLPNAFLLVTEGKELFYGHFTSLILHLEKDPVLNLLPMTGEGTPVLTVGRIDGGLALICAGEGVGLQALKDGTATAVSLPEGYTEAGLKKAVFGLRRVLVYEGAVFLTRADGAKEAYEKHEGLSGLEKDLRSLAVNGQGEILVLMSDGVIYRVTG